MLGRREGILLTLLRTDDTVREATLKAMDHLGKQFRVREQMCVFKSYSLNNRENGEVCLKLTQMGRA